jgi:hypothetical protein
VGLENLAADGIVIPFAASRRLIVSRSADSSAAWNCSSDTCRAARARIAANNPRGRGMLAMGSVGIGMVYGSLPELEIQSLAS